MSEITDSQIEADDIIFIVKGAGTHKPDDSLNVFLNGFIPAIKSIDPEAKVRQLNNPKKLGKIPKSPHTKEHHNHLTEITFNYNKKDLKCKNKDNNTKNTNLEDNNANNTNPECKEQDNNANNANNTNPEGNNANNTNQEKKIWVKEIYWENELIPSNPWKAFFIEWQMASYALRRFITLNILHCIKCQYISLLAISIVNMFVLCCINATLILSLHFLFKASNGISFLGSSNLWVTVFNQSNRLEIIAIFIVSFIMALYPSCAAGVYWSKDIKYRKLSGLPTWVMVLLSISFLLFTEKYIFLFFTILIPILFSNLLRGLLWKHRTNKNKTYNVNTLNVKIGSSKVTTRINVSFIRFFYRLSVVLMLPILFFTLLFAKFLKVTKILGAIGDSIERFMTSLLGDILGDVSSFAMDPAQAHRIRSVVENEIIHFEPKVNHIHIFAHSQGTAITFETLFRQLEGKNRKKIKSYITIGSILSYYYSVSSILEYNYPPTRFRLKSYPPFAEGFKWVNCWNLLDPITGFYGLDEFDHNCNRSPNNIKTRALSHSDYWRNVREVHIPFVNHILGCDKDDFWKESKKIKTNILFNVYPYNNFINLSFWLPLIISAWSYKEYLEYFTFSISRNIIEPLYVNVYIRYFHETFKLVFLTIFKDTAIYKAINWLLIKFDLSIYDLLLIIIVAKVLYDIIIVASSFLKKIKAKLLYNSLLPRA